MTGKTTQCASIRVLLWLTLAIAGAALAGCLALGAPHTAFADDNAPTAQTEFVQPLTWKESANRPRTDLFDNGNVSMVATVNGKKTVYPVGCWGTDIAFQLGDAAVKGTFAKQKIRFGALPAQDDEGNPITWSIKVDKAPTGYSMAKKDGKIVFTEKVLGTYSISKKTLTLKNTREHTLKIKGCAEKVKWTSSNSKVAKVTSKGLVKAGKKGTCTITATTAYSKKTFKCKVTVKDPQTRWLIKAPRYNQGSYGYPLGCEGVSFYMALKSQGYLKNMSLHQFMATQPHATRSSNYNPDTGYAGSPRQGKGYGVNYGKRTSIYPKAVEKWGRKLGANVVSIQGASVKELQEEIKKGNPCLVWVTTDWQGPYWRKYPFSRALQVENNHCTLVTGYDAKTGSYHITDCSQTRGSYNCKYWISKGTFEYLYNLRHFAVSVRKK